MRFHCLSLENITSLRGKHEINFDHILKTDDLFAITGPTGSGKSSILSAITLALYGKMSKQGLNQGDFVSLGEKKARIDLEFSVSNKRLKAFWEAKKKGETYSSQRRFVDDNDEEVPFDILPLSYEEFSKTIILAQGEFAKFLTSTFTERKNILEKIYGDNFLENLSPLVSSHLRKKEDEMSHLLELEKTILPFSKEDFNSLKEENLSLEGLLKERNIKKEKMTLFSNEVKEILSSHKKKLELNKKEENLKISLSKITIDYNKEEEILLELDEDYNKRRQTLEDLRPILLDFIKKEEKKVQLEKQTYEHNQRLKSLKQKKELALKKQEEDQKKIALLKEKMASFSKDIPPSFSPKENSFSQIKNLSSGIEGLLISKKKEDEFLENLKAQDEALNLELKNIAEGKKIFKEEDFLSQKKGVQDKISRKTQEQKLLVKLEEIKKELKSHLHLKGSFPLERLEENLKSFFKTIAHKEGFCPICESKVDKSFSKETILNFDAFYEKEIASQTKLHFFEEFTSHSLKDLQDGEEKDLYYFEEKLKKIEAKEIELLKLNEFEHHKKNALEKNRCEKEDLKRSIQKSSFEIESLKEQLKEKIKALGLFFDESLSFKDNTLSWEKIFKSFEEKNNIEKILWELEKHLEQTISEEKNLSREESELLLKTENITKELSALNALLKETPSPTQALKDEEKCLEEKRILKGNQSKNLQKILSTKSYTEAQGKSVQENIYELNLFETKNWIKLKNFLKNNEDILESIPLKLFYLETLRDIEDWSLLDLFYEENLKREIENLHFFILEKKEIFDKNSAKLSLYNDKKNEQDKILLKLNQEKKEFEILKNLHTLVGNDEFRNYILSLIEKELIVYANEELKLFCDGRFFLEQIDIKKGNDFFVIDHFKNGERRKVSTLSGGETFLVSLALSMALSEMGRGSASIESFFIDEGFGTLDEDSLTQVLEALYALKSRGKTVGVISHIKELTERIPINIRLQKKQNGESSLELIYN